MSGSGLLNSIYIALCYRKGEKKMISQIWTFTFFLCCAFSVCGGGVLQVL